MVREPETKVFVECYSVLSTVGPSNERLYYLSGKGWGRLAWLDRVPTLVIAPTGSFIPVGA